MFEIIIKMKSILTTFLILNFHFVLIFKYKNVLLGLVEFTIRILFLFIHLFLLFVTTLVCCSAETRRFLLLLTAVEILELLFDAVSASSIGFIGSLDPEIC
jgi:hypothetical protein